LFGLEKGILIKIRFEEITWWWASLYERNMAITGRGQNPRNYRAGQPLEEK